MKESYAILHFARQLRILLHGDVTIFSTKLVITVKAWAKWQENKLLHRIGDEMTIESMLAFVLALLAWVVIPGPAIFAIVGRSLTTDLRSALLLIGGILLGDIFYMSIVLFGLAAIGQILGDIFQVVRLVGAIYLVFLGTKMWLRDSKSMQPEIVESKTDKYKNFLTGVSITLGNPKAIIFHMGFLPTFFDLTAISVLNALQIIVTFVIVLGGSLTMYAYGASKARNFFRDEQRMRILNRGAGTILIGAGVAIATKK